MSKRSSKLASDIFLLIYYFASFLLSMVHAVATLSFCFFFLACSIFTSLVGQYNYMYSSNCLFNRNYIKVGFHPYFVNVK